MATVWWEHPGLQKIALFDENGTSGAKNDPDAARNAPFKTPSAHLDKVRFHSDLDYMEVSHGPTDVTVSHAEVAAGTGPSGDVGINGVMVYSTVTTSHTLLNHNLGYVPDFFVIYDSDIIYPGRPVQVLSDGRTRKVAVEATTSIIRLKEWAVRTGNAMAAASRTYTVVVFKRPPAPSGNVMKWWDPATGVLHLARGKFRSDRRYLQIVAGGTPYGFSKGRMIDRSNGAVRYVDPDGSQFEPVPSDFGMYIAMPYDIGGFTVPSMAYDGSFAGSPSVLVKLP